MNFTWYWSCYWSINSAEELHKICRQVFFPITTLIYQYLKYNHNDSVKFSKDLDRAKSWLKYIYNETKSWCWVERCGVWTLQSIFYESAPECRVDWDLVSKLDLSSRTQFCEESQPWGWYFSLSLCSRPVWPGLTPPASVDRVNPLYFK